MCHPPAVVVGNHIAALIRGETPSSLSNHAELLRAMRTMLSGAACPANCAAMRNDLALQVLQALSSKLQAEVRTEQAIRQAERRE